MSTAENPPATTDDATPAPASGGAAKKVIGVLVGVILGVMGPGMVLAALGLPAVLNTWILASLGGWMVGMFVGRHLGLLLAIGLGIFLTLAYGLAAYPWLAGVVVGCAAAAYGATARWGVSGRLVTGMVILAFTVAQPTPILTDAGVWPNASLTGLVGLLAALWGVAVGRLMGKNTPKPPLAPMSAQQATYFAWTVAVVLGTATWFVSYLTLGHGGAWFLLTIIVILQPRFADTLTKTLHRAIGTVAGFVIALIVALVVPWTGLIMLLAVVFMTIAMVLVMKPGTPYWQFVTFLTPAIVLLEGAGSSIVQTDMTRLGFTLLGVAVGLVVLGIAYLVRQRAGDGSSQPSDNAAAGTLPPLGPSEPAP